MDPFTIASIIAMIVGTASQVKAKHKQKRALEEVAQNDLARKQETAKESRAIFDAEMQKSGVGNAEAEAEAAALQQLESAQGLINRPDTGFVPVSDTAAMKDSAPIVKEAAAKNLSDELQKVDAQMKARATLQGFQQRFQDRAQQFGRASDNMRMLHGFNQGWDQVANQERAIAQTAGTNQAMLGDVLVGLGSIGLMGAAGRAAGAAGASAGQGLTAGATGQGLTAGSTAAEGLSLSGGSARGLTAPSTWGYTPNAVSPQYSFAR